MKIIVIGGGAAGFFGAITCKQFNPENEVIILEKTTKILAKVKVSGGGRCNVTHACFENNLLLKNYPRGHKELRKSFQEFSTKDTMAWFQSRGVKLKTEADGRVFPVSDNSESIIDCLVSEAEMLGVKVWQQQGVKSITPLDHGFSIHTDKESSIFADKVLIATGGSPQISGYNWLSKTNHTIVPPAPSLFTFNSPSGDFKDLMGITVPNALVRVAGTSFSQNGSLLITHWGFSGPAVLKLSAWAARDLAEKEYNFNILINWIGEDFTEVTLRGYLELYRVENAKKIVSSNQLFGLPQRLWKKLCSNADLSEEVRWGEIPKKQYNKLIDNLLNTPFEVKGKTTFKEEFVTAGGIKLSEINLETFESKLHSGLFFAGEVIDVDGVTGGFNFQNAWTSGYLSGRNMAE
jgi:predicted Rossmann fold flavoprotein